MAVGYQPITASTDTTFEDLAGWNFTETAGAVARVLIRKDTITGDIVADIKLAAGQSVGTEYPDPIHVESGVYVEVNAGAVRGAIYGG